jgi:hypothetical protein
MSRIVHGEAVDLGRRRLEAFVNAAPVLGELADKTQQARRERFGGPRARHPCNDTYLFTMKRQVYFD